MNQMEQLLDFKVLEKLRQDGDVQFIFLRTLLELTSLPSSASSSSHLYRTHYESLVFHCVSGFRHVTLRHWDLFSKEFQTVSRDFLFSLGLGWGYYSSSSNRDSGIPPCSSVSTKEYESLFPRTLLTTSLHTAATFWKKSWCDYDTHGNQYDPDMVKDEQQQMRMAMEQVLIQAMKFHCRVPLHTFTSTQHLLDTLDSFMTTTTIFQPTIPTAQSSSTQQQQQQQQQQETSVFMACQATTFFIQLIQEFSGSSKNNTLGQQYQQQENTQIYYHSSLETHRFIHDTFESQDLKRVLHIALNTLGNIVTMGSSSDTSSSCSTTTTIQNILPKIPFISQLLSLSCEVLSWDFKNMDGGIWDSSHDKNNYTSTSSLIRPPEEWRDYIIRPELLSLLFQLYSIIRSSASASAASNLYPYNKVACYNLGHDIRQFLLLLSSLTGIIFVNTQERFAYFQFLLDGLLQIISTILLDCQSNSSSSWSLPDILQSLEAEIVDMADIVLKLVINLKIQNVSKLSSFESFLRAIVALSSILLSADVEECKQVQGDMESMQGLAWRSEALATLLEACSLMSEDLWLQVHVGTLSSSTMTSTSSPIQSQQQRSEEATRVYLQLSNIISPLYPTFIQCRIDMAKMEDYYLTIHNSELDEDREDIYAQIMDDEMKMVATALGRLNSLSSCHFLFTIIQESFPRVMCMFSSTLSSPPTTDAAVLLEEARVLILCAGHLLTDECDGETPLIPSAVISGCGTDPESTQVNIVMNITFAIKSLMESQASSLAMNPNNMYLSPLLAKTLLWFFYRWIPGYMSSDNSQPCIFLSTDMSHAIIEFLTTYCWHILCYWPLENSTQESVCNLLLSMTKCGPAIRNYLMTSQNFFLLVNLHCASASLSHQSTEQDISQSIINISGMNVTIASLATSLPRLVKDYRRVAYTYRARILTFIVMIAGKSEHDKELSKATLYQVYNSIEQPFETLIESLRKHSLSTDNHNTRELVHLLIELFNGAAKVNDMTCGEKSILFLTKHLSSLASLMSLYALDSVICEALLRFFRDYAENFIFILNQEQSLALFSAISILLKSYSTQMRTINKSSNTGTVAEADEEQKYQDVMYAIQLLIHVGSKDFVDTCGSSEMGDVIDFVFYGLQQIIPLMTKGLFHFQKLAFQYFSLVGFIMDVYAEKLCTLPYDLFQSLVNSLLFGMSHLDPLIAKSSLDGLSGFARELVKNDSFRSQLNMQRPDLIESWSYRLLHEVIFQPIIWDRLVPAGMAMLPLVAMDLDRFAKAVQSLCSQLDSVSKQDRLRQAFEKLLNVDILSKCSTSGGLDGRMNRLRFKKDFEVFVREIHSFLIIK